MDIKSEGLTLKTNPTHLSVNSLPKSGKKSVPSVSQQPAIDAIDYLAQQAQSTGQSQFLLQSPKGGRHYLSGVGGHGRRIHALLGKRCDAKGITIPTAYLCASLKQPIDNRPALQALLETENSLLAYKNCPYIEQAAKSVWVNSKETMAVMVKPQRVPGDQLVTDMHTPPSTLFSMLAGATKGLASIHKAGDVHRDVKLQNMQFDPSTGIGILADVELRQKEGTAPRNRVIIGTIPYYNRERLKSARGYCYKEDDLNAIGVSLVKMIAKRRSQLHVCIREAAAALSDYLDLRTMSKPTTTEAAGLITKLASLQKQVETEQAKTNQVNQWLILQINNLASNLRSKNQTAIDRTDCNTDDNGYYLTSETTPLEEPVTSGNYIDDEQLKEELGTKFSRNKQPTTIAK